MASDTPGFAAREVALGALIAGLLVGLIGDRPTLIGVIIVFAAAAFTAALSPLREAPIRG